MNLRLNRPGFFRTFDQQSIHEFARHDCTVGRVILTALGFGPNRGGNRLLGAGNIVVLYI